MQALDALCHHCHHQPRHRMNPANQGHHQTNLQAGIRQEQGQTARTKNTFSDRQGFDDLHDQHQQHHGGNSHLHDHSHSHDHDHGGHGHGHSHDHSSHGHESLGDDDAVHEEMLHFHKIIKAFSQYKASAMYANHRRRTDFYSLPERQQK